VAKAIDYDGASQPATEGRGKSRRTSKLDSGNGKYPHFSKETPGELAILDTMNLRLSPIVALAVAFCFAGSGAFAGDDVPKPAAKRGAIVKEAARGKKEASTVKPAPRFWQRSTDQPCDSSACRPFRFAWSPVAPGA
jgi:hypothetical protein